MSIFSWLRPKEKPPCNQSVPVARTVETPTVPELTDYERGLLLSLTDEFNDWIFSINETPIPSLDQCLYATTLHNTKRWITLKRVKYTICGSRRYESGYRIQYNGLSIDDRVEKAFLEKCTTVIRERHVRDQEKSLSELREKLSTPPDLTK